MHLIHECQTGWKRKWSAVICNIYVIYRFSQWRVSLISPLPYTPIRCAQHFLSLPFFPHKSKQAHTLSLSLSLSFSLSLLSLSVHLSISVLSVRLSMSVCLSLFSLCSPPPPIPPPSLPPPPPLSLSLSSLQRNQRQKVKGIPHSMIHSYELTGLGWASLILWSSCAVLFALLVA